ncbi:ABC transporter ATP-binding protein [candidate division KSB1 bacterium]|nr:ABC transporter ATP-binding protein [candidate division KSB1 bacterium]
MVRDFYFHHSGPIDLDIESNERVGLSGPSGAGKSLFLRALADLDPHTGELLWNGRSAQSMPGWMWRRHIGLLPSEHSWWYDRVGDHFHSMDEPALKSFGFETDVMEWPVSRLSSGEKQRLAIYRLLCNEPAALLLDEPTANLDAENSRRIEDILARYQLCRQTPLLLVSHDLRQIEKFATRHIEISDGRFVESPMKREEQG